MKPLIALNGGSAVDDLLREQAVSINWTYSAAVTAGGGVAVLATDPEAADEYARICDGLVLTGSQIYCTDPERLPAVLEEERFGRPGRDRSFLEAFIRAGKPVLGICLGLQCINLYFGGTLEDHFKLRDGVEHLLCAHPVDCNAHSFTAPLFGPCFMVNSRHDRRIGLLGRELLVSAQSPDGVIEEILHERLPIWAVEYHPERMRGDFPEPYNGPDMTPLFAWFAQQCVSLRKEAAGKEGELGGK